MTGDVADAGPGVRETVAAVLAEHPVTLGFIFGSLARDEAHEQSDVDVAVVFDALSPGDPGYNDALFGLSADLAAALGTDDVDVVDLRRASPSLARAVVEDGLRLVGTDDQARRLRETLTDGDVDEDRSAADRFDELLAAIDDHVA